MSRRGSYAKGVAKRDEILARALEIVGADGYRAASVKEIADAVGLSQPGLLHYFGSKEELWVALLRKRDEADHIASDDSADDLRSGFLDVIRRNASTPGLVELFSRQAVEAADPAHPAHGFFRERGEALRSRLAEARPEPAAGIPPQTLARIVQAVADGIQLQWLLDPDVDMAGTVDALLTLIAAEEVDA